MTETLNALLDQPLLLPVLLTTGAALGVGVEKFFSGLEREKRKAYWAGRKARAGQGSGASLQVIRDREAAQDARTGLAATQLKAVMQAGFKPQALLNRPERRLLACIDQALAECSPGWRAMGQVSLGEVLYSADKEAFMAINAKRVDLLIIDAECRPLHAIEFQGTGHHGSAETAARDAVKKEALRRAGIGYIEVVSGDTPAEVRAMIRKLVARGQRPATGFGRKIAGGKAG